MRFSPESCVSLSSLRSLMLANGEQEQNAKGLSLSVPMPGHPVPQGSVEKTKEDVSTLENLFDEHDVIFLLMDSRESRWLPTVLGAAKGKVCCCFAVTRIADRLRATW